MWLSFYTIYLFIHNPVYLVCKSLSALCDHFDQDTQRSGSITLMASVIILGVLHDFPLLHSERVQANAFQLAIKIQYAIITKINFRFCSLQKFTLEIHTFFSDIHIIHCSCTNFLIVCQSEFKKK